jgi:predicted nucleotidyltransferase
MEGMSFEESILLEVMRAVHAVKLDAVLVGNAAAALVGVPVTTQDIDLFVRDTPLNQEKIKQFATALGDHVQASRPFEPVSRMIRLEGLAVDVDFVFNLSSRAKFESVKSRAQTIDVEGVKMQVADLKDVIEAKRAAARPKDLATLPLLEEFLRVRDAIGNDE